MLEKTKEAIKKPAITPTQIVLFALLTIWVLVTNLKHYQNLDVGWQIAIQIGFYVAIMLTAGQRGSVASLVRSIIEIIVSTDPDEQKMIKLQNLVVALCQELGLLYEKEKERFYAFLNGTNAENGQKIQELEEEIKKLESQLADPTI